MRSAVALAILLVPASALAIRIKIPKTRVNATIGPATKRVGPLASDDLERTVKARTGLYLACYEKAVWLRSSIGGKPLIGNVILQFAVEPDGTVKKVDIVAAGTTLKNESVQGCLQSNVMRLAFPDAAAQTKVVYPMKFTSK